MEQFAPNGTEHVGDHHRLACFTDRLLGSRHPITVAVLGGSVSAGSTYTVRHDSHLFHWTVGTALRGFGSPGSNVTVSVHNGALPATGPSFFEHCLTSQLPAEPDLVLVEFTVNLDHQPAAFERLVRKLLALPRRPAIVVVSMHSWRIVELATGRRVSPWRCSLPKENHSLFAARPTDQQWADQDPRGDEDRIAEICRHYNLPLVSVRSALLGAVRSGTVPLRAFMHDCRCENSPDAVCPTPSVCARRLRGTQPALLTGRISRLVTDTRIGRATSQLRTLSSSASDARAFPPAPRYRARLSLVRCRSPCTRKGCRCRTACARGALCFASSWCNPTAFNSRRSVERSRAWWAWHQETT